MTTTIDENMIYKAINEIRSKHKRRPDKECIWNHLLVKHGLAKSLTINSIDGMIEEGKIYNKKTTGEDSYFISEGTKLEDKTEECCISNSQSIQAGGIEQMEKTLRTSSLLACLIVAKPSLIVRTHILLQATRAQST